MAIALIKFTQGVSVGVAGRAMKGVLTTNVSVENGSNTGVASWQLDLLYVDPASSLVASIPFAFSNSGSTPSATFVPDVRGSYRWQLKVWDVPNRAGNPADVDIRVFSVPEARGLVVPPPQLWPAPLPQLESGLDGAKPNEMNFDGQPDGWAGNGDDDGLANELIRRVDALGEPVDPETPSLSEVLTVGNVTGSNDIVLSNTQALTGTTGTSGSGQDGGDAIVRGGPGVDNGNGGDVTIEGGAPAGSGDKGQVVIHDMVDPTDPQDGVNLRTLEDAVGGIVSGVSSVFGRTGVVVAQSGDYNSDNVNNDSSLLSGSGSVSDALENLDGRVPPLPTAIGQILYASAIDTWTLLNIGTPKQRLTVSATGGVPVWESSANISKFTTNNSPIGLYNFEDTINDTSGNGRHLSGTPIFSDGLPGFRGFYATSGNILIGPNDNAFRLTGDMTIYVMVQYNSPSQTGPVVCCMASGEVGSTDNFLYQITMPAPGAPSWFSEHSTGVNDSYTPSGVQIPYIHNMMWIAARRSSNQIQFFINGRLRGTAGTLTAPDGGSASRFYINGNADGNTIDAIIGAVKVCNTAHANQTIFDEWNNTWGPFYGMV